MAASKNLRSSRGMGSAPDTHHNNPPKKREKRNKTSVTSKNPSITSSASTGEADDSGTIPTSTDSAAADKDDEMADAFAPSGGTTLPGQAGRASGPSVAPSATFHEVIQTSQAGLLSTSRMDESMRNETNEHDTNESNVRGIGSGRLLDDLSNYELNNDLIEDGDDEDAASESGSFATSVGGLDLDNDDGYEGIDGISNDSDDSAAFEAEIEREIQAEGEQGIDWDDVHTYQYNEDWNTGLYDLGTGGAIVDHAADFDLFGTFDTGVTQPTAEISKPYSFEDFTDRGFFGDDTQSSAFDTPESSPRPSGSDPVAPSFVDPMEVEGLAELDGDETDDDDELEANESTINSPSVEVMSRRESRLLNHRPHYPADDADLPPLRRIACNPRRAVAVTADSPMGRYIQYLTPRGRAYRWITLRRSAPNSRPESTLSSPTMINFDDAIMHGNTRTGAHVTDIIHGYAFALRHCTHQSAHETSTPNRFYERFHTTLTEDEDWDIRDLDADEDDVMQLVDFSECVESVMPPSRSSSFPGPSTSYGRTSTGNMLPPVTDDVLRTPMIQTPQRNDENSTSSLTDRMGALPLDSSLSPKKRRLSSRSNTAPDFGMSPLEKKARLTTLTNAIN